MKEIKQHLPKGMDQRRWGITAVAVLALLILAVILFNRINENKETKESGQSTAHPVSQTQEEVVLCDYSKMKISTEATQEELEAEIANVIEAYTTYEELSGTVEDGKKIYIDYVGRIDGKKNDKVSGSDFLKVGSGDLSMQFEKELIGLKTGVTKKFSLTIPKGKYDDAAIDGHVVEYMVTVEYICGEAIVPQYNDQLIRSISNKKTVKQYNNYLKKKIKKKKEKNIEGILWQMVVEESKIQQYPKDLLNVYKKEILEEYALEATKKQCSKDEIYQQYGYEDEDNFKKFDLPGLAKDKVKEVLVARAIAKKEGISYSEDEQQDNATLLSVKQWLVSHRK